MPEYRITKYDPANRVDGVYVAEDWTSFSDIGKVFGGVKLSRDVYLKTETAYVECCIELVEKAKISTLFIEQPEYYTESAHFPPAISSMEEIRQVIVACLREQCWLKLTAKDFFIHFGYDYYMYIGSVLPGESIAETAAQHGLYCERYASPYSL